MTIQRELVAVTGRFTPKSYQENRRTSFVLGDVHGIDLTAISDLRFRTTADRA